MIESAPAMLRFLALRCAAEAPVIAALATINSHGTGRVRHVVLRSVNARRGTLWISSHVDADKVHHLRARPLAELAIWLPTERLQVRLLAHWHVIDAATRSPANSKARRAAWKSHSPTAKALFTWPAPGRPLSTHPPAASVLPASTPPPSFALLTATVRQLDILHIQATNHQRYLHQRRGDAWRTRSLTP